MVQVFKKFNNSLSNVISNAATLEQEKLELSGTYSATEIPVLLVTYFIIM